MKNLTLGYEKFTIITLNNTGRGGAGLGGDREGRGEVGLKILNPSLPRPMVRG